jgi:hypothetical protein
VDVDALTDERRCPRTAKSCGSGALMLGAKFSLIAPKASRGQRWQTQWFTEKSTYKPRAGVIPLYLWSTRARAIFLARGPRVHADTRPSLRPLFREGEMTGKSSGETRREDEVLCLRRTPFEKL